MRKLAAIAAITVALLVFPAAASAKTLFFEGNAKGDNESDVRFEAKGKLKKGKKKKKFVAKQVSTISVENELFSCYKADGSLAIPPSGGWPQRSTLPYPFYEIEPTKVDKKGKFSGSASYTPPGGEAGGPTYVVEFKGKIKNKKATGTYQAKYDPGGINYGFCGDKDPVEWEADGLPIGTPPDE